MALTLGIHAYALNLMASDSAALAASNLVAGL